jgi:hypothetical protein
LGLFGLFEAAHSGRRRLLGRVKVNSGGRTNWLWIKQGIGVCGELWLVSVVS